MVRLFLRPFWGLLLCGVIANSSVAFAVVVKQASKPRPDFPSKAARQPVTEGLRPHRAVYEITLADKKQAVSVSAIRGRMVFEITGSPCEGYTQNMRMVTRTTDEQGKISLSDIRSSTWERGNGRRFRFSSSQYFDQELQEVVSGSAKRSPDGRTINVKIRKPQAVTLELPGDALFPTQHSLALVKAAKTGKRRLNVRVFDGSEQGQGFYQTYSFIGNRVPASRPGSSAREGQKGKMSQRAAPTHRHLTRLGLARLPSWPVAVSYFNGVGNSDDTAPAYELSFRLYPNGVSRNLLINYGNFSVHGRLARIKYLRAGACKRK